ncbi:(3S,6E)-nerolidol synthase 1 [Rosa chinensis]|uniref:(3S,6E)-nerolidol synthase 1 n=1 Tax=Rosa chinensis TaxID=74649 RepID=UPI001AD8F8B0|nr:(3S,6E)-nerolidol synthase 1 [Rosa chinensis]
MASILQAHSASSKSEIGDLHVRREEKLRELKETLANAGEDQLQQLVMVDAMQRLGVAYLFQNEIYAILEKQYTRSSAYNGDDDGNHQLLEASLRFRLLRQQGFPVTPDAEACNKIKNNEKLKSGLIASDEDINGLVELCEASHLSFQGEEMLDEAGKLSRQLLTAWVSNNHNDHRVTLVERTLEHPYHKSLTRFMAKKFLNNFQGQEKWVCSLQELANLEFNMVESIIQNEILLVSGWWKELGLTRELKFVRDQPIKWYTWPMACLVDPRLSEERIELTKAVSLVYIIDDIFDVRGTLDELVLFTAAVARWDTATNDELPNYMKTCFKALNDITNNISQCVHEKHGWNPIEILRESWIRLCKAFLVEAQWFRRGELPNSGDYLKNGIISSGVPAFLTHAFCIIGQGMIKETIDLFNNINLPSIVSSTAMILRLWDDFGTAKDEDQNGFDGSYIECYMKEHKGSSVEEVQAYVIQKISDEWKCLNQECFSACNPFSESFTQFALNISRMVPMMYDYNAHHCLPSLEENMKSLLSDSFLAKGIYGKPMQ